MKFRTTLTLALMVSTAAIALAQGKTMQAKPMTKMKVAPGSMMPSKAEWQRNYDMAAKSFEKKDVDAVFKYMTPDFTMTMMGQTMKAGPAKAGLKQWFGMVKDHHMKFTITGVKNNGNMVMVMDKVSSWGTMMDPKTKKWGKFTDTGMETATWVRVKGKWMMKKLVSTGEKMTFNGKPYNMMGG